MLKRLSFNILVYGITNIIKSLVPFIMLPILTLYISPNEYGELSLIETSVLFLLPFIMLNINGAINVEFFKLEKNEYKKYVLNAIFISFCAFIIVMFFLFIFRENLSNLMHLKTHWILLLGIFAFMRVLSSVILVIFQASQQVKKYAVFSITQTVTDFLLSYIFVVLFKLSIIGRLLGEYGAFFIFSLISIFLLFKMGFFNVKFTLKYTKDILKFGLPLIPHSIGGIILAMSDRYFISYFEGNKYVGLYTVAYQVSAILLLISTSVNQAWSSMFFKMMKDKNYDKIKMIIRILIFLFIIATFFIYEFSDFIYKLLISKEYYSSKTYFIYLLLGFLFQSIYFLFTNFLFFYKKTHILSMITIAGGIINLFLNYFFIKKFGTVGVAYATAITWFLYLISVFSISVYFFKRNNIE